MKSPPHHLRPRISFHRRWLRRVAGISVAAASAACYVPLGQPQSLPQGTPSTPELGAFVAAVMAESNVARADAGVGPLTPDPDLNRAASEYAVELAGLRRLDHRSETRGRETMRDRIDAVGVLWQGAAENLAARSGSARVVPPMIVRDWLGSPGHRRNLLNAEYSLAGTGVARDIHGVWYVVQLYVKPRRADR